MNETWNHLEQIIGRNIPEVPAELRGDVESIVRKRLEIQTFRDDAKWLGLSFGLLFLVVASQWCLFRNAGSQLRDFSNTSIASTKSGQNIPAAIRATGWQFAAPGQDSL